MRRAAQAGVSLIELMIAVVVIGIVLALGLPAYGTWIQNVQIRTASEAILNGLQTARNEAIRRNTGVQFKLDNGTTAQWRVNLFSDPDGTPLQSRPAEEGTPNATATATPGGADTVTFSALGRVITNADASASIARIDIDNTTITVVADRRNLQIMIPPGGAIRLCDPKVVAGDPRTC
jgi:type IV fimbrial biogenesis protein FimT